MKNKKVLILTYYWHPSGGPGVQRWLKFVKYLPSFGITPAVLTVKPECAEYPVIDESLGTDLAADLEIYRTDCKGMYDLYKKIARVKTAPYSGFANEGNPTLLQKAARFIRGNFFLPDARRGWVKYAFRESCRIIEQQDIATVITTGPPHSTHLTGCKLKRKYGIRWIADFRDPWTNIQYKSFLYQTGWARKKDLEYERQVLRLCDVLLLAVDERARLQKIHPDISPDKMLFVPNGYDEEDFAGKTPQNPLHPLITYTGTIAANYPLDGLLQALAQLADLPFTLRFVGKVDEKTQAACRQRLGNRVEFIPFVPHGKSIDYLMSSSVLLLVNARVEGVQFLLHGKIFEYLASGKPILLLGAPEGKSAQIIREAGAGQAFDYNDADGISRFLSEQCAHPAPHAHPEYVRRFSRKQLAQTLAQIIENV
ncbi:MAG: glycosyltransferase [Bacteroidales bacterium]|nr:glycosyltransferase [Bacteroidales bacterium]